MKPPDLAPAALFGALLLALLFVSPATAGESSADRRGPPGGPPRPEGPVEGSGTPARERTLIQWYGTLDGARAEAQRSGRPILLVAAAPQCHGVSGIW